MRGIPRKWKVCICATVFLTICAVVSAAVWVNVLQKRAESQASVVDAILRAGGKVGYRFRRSTYINAWSVGGVSPAFDDDASDHSPSWPEWLRKRIGEDAFDPVVRVEFPELLKAEQDELALAAITAIGKCKELEVVDLTHLGVRNEWYEQLRGLNSVTEFRVSPSNPHRPFTPNDEALKVIGSLHSLVHLEIGGTTVTDEGVRHLRNLSNLKTLDISVSVDDPFGKNGLWALGELNSLRNLTLSCEVTDEGMRWLSDMKHLEALTLFSAHLSDESVKTLGQLQNLRKLRFGDIGITDEGLKNLQELLPDCDIQRLIYTDNAFDGATNY
jgi:hypothetical protein